MAYHKITKVIVISDTHLQSVDELPPDLVSALADAEVVIHLGDFTSGQLLNQLRGLGKFYGIWGNHDGPDIRRQLNKREVIEVGGKRIGLLHGVVFPFGCHKRMKNWFREHKIDAVLYGHTHVPVCRVIDGVTVFNPGSVTAQFPAKQASFGVLSLDGTIRGQIIPIAYGTNNKRFLYPLRAFLIRLMLCWVEPWFYLDLLGFMKNTGRIIKEGFTSIRAKLGKS